MKKKKRAYSPPTTHPSEEMTDIHRELEALRQKVQEGETAVAELRRRSDIQEAQNQMLTISLLPISLQEQLQKILLLILHIPWLALEEKGCIFLTNDSQTELMMVAHHNLSDALHKMCAQVPYGQCLCGRAAASKELLFKRHIDDDHDYHPAGMKAHGHYILPIISAGKTLGILNLYVKDGHLDDILEYEFLQSSSKLLAGIIDRKNLEQKLRQMSYHDELTGIANRRSFMEHLSRSISTGQRIQRNLAVLFLDLDYFKAINDHHGHDFGDEVLVEAARRMGKNIRKSDLIARLGGDEFVICLNLLDDKNYALQVGHKVQQAISQPYWVKNTSLEIGVSIGISLYPEHGLSAEVLLKKADIALYQAKETRGSVAIYDANYPVVII